ncbi:MAG: hypothetical protein ABI361_02085 [Nitrososphaera sp.]
MSALAVKEDRMPTLENGMRAISCNYAIPLYIWEEWCRRYPTGDRSAALASLMAQHLGLVDPQARKAVLRASRK